MRISWMFRSVSPSFFGMGSSPHCHEHGFTPRLLHGPYPSPPQVAMVGRQSGIALVPNGLRSSVEAVLTAAA